MNLISEEEAKAIEKKVTKGVTDLQAPNRGYDYKDDKALNNVSGEQFRQGYFTELTDVANEDKTKQELIDLVIKNISKNPLYYVEEAQFGIKGLGYSEDQPALGKGKMVKDPGVGGGYGAETKKDFPEGEVGTGYIEIKENKNTTNMISLLDLYESGPLGEKELPKKTKKKKVKKETTDSKLAEIEKNGRVATLELQIEALEEIIEGKNGRISMVTEDDNLSELVDKKKMKEMQREVKLLEKKKAGMERMYEKMCGKSYTKKEMVGEVDAINERGEYKNNKDKVSTDKVIKYISSQASELKKNPKLWGAVQFFMGQLDNPQTSMFAGYNGDKPKLDSMVAKLEDENEFGSVINKAFDFASK